MAAGSGERLGADRPKAFVVLAGRPMLDWSLDALRAAGITDVVVAAPAGWDDLPPGVTAVPGGGDHSGVSGPAGAATTTSAMPAAASASSDHSSIGRPASTTNALGRSAPRRSPLPAATRRAAAFTC